VKKFQANKNKGSIISVNEPIKPFRLFSFFMDKYTTLAEQKKQKAQNELNTNNAGHRIREKKERKEGGRRVKTLDMKL
jgi:hypothetical protein